MKYFSMFTGAGVFGSIYFFSFLGWIGWLTKEVFRGYRMEELYKE